MRRSELLAALAVLVCAWPSYGLEPPPSVVAAERAKQQAAIKPAPSVPSPAPPQASPPQKPASAPSVVPVARKKGGPPSCVDLDSAVDSTPSSGAVNVPVTANAVGTQDPDALAALNGRFSAGDVERMVLDPTTDVQSAARLLSGFRCFASWSAQHEFYRRVARESKCPLLEHRAIGLLEYDLCNAETVSVLLGEYPKASLAPTRELILRLLGTSRDKRATLLLDQTIKSGDPVLSKIAYEAKEHGQNQSCSAQNPAAKPYYGVTSVADVCMGVGQAPPAAPTAAAPAAGASATGQPGATTQPAASPMSAPASAGGAGNAGGAENVSF